MTYDKDIYISAAMYALASAISEANILSLKHPDLMEKERCDLTVQRNRIDAILREFAND